jgi:hypothetical protein
VTLDDLHRSCFDETVYREFRRDRRLRPFVECGWLRSGLATCQLALSMDQSVHDGAGFLACLVVIFRPCHVEGHFTHRAEHR